MNEFTGEIKEMALSLGFSACGIAPVHSLNADQDFLQSWIQRGFQGQLHYMERNIEQRGDPAKILEGAKSVISVLSAYEVSNRTTEEKYKIARYVTDTDYHIRIKEMLQSLMARISEHDKTANSIACVDSAPVFDKRWAQQAGLGWIGKNTLLVNPDFGTWFNLGEIITTAVFDYDEPLPEHCGTCRKCIDACPTMALTDAITLDATKCIAYLTIEPNAVIDASTPDDFHGYIFGCDICQDACPYNKKILSKPRTGNDSTIFNDQIRNLSWENISREEFATIFRNTALKRTGYDHVMRNLRRNPGYSSV